MTAEKPLCGLGTLYYYIDGERFQKLFPTRRAIDCSACRKAIEMIVRKQLENLSAQGMEKVLGMIRDMRNGDLWE